MPYKAYMPVMLQKAYIANMLFRAYSPHMSYLLQTPDQLAVHMRALRQAKGWSQKQLAAKLGLSQSRIARIEHDPLSISVDQMLKVLTVLGASMRIQLDADRSQLMAMPAPQVSATGTNGTPGVAPESPAGKVITKSEQGDW